jgi:carboxymethylenebutenolidase
LHHPPGGTVISESLTIDVAGNPMQAYLARPDDATPRPAVIVLQEIFGVNTEVKRITDLVAGAGYVGLAINYYHRTHPDLNEPYTRKGMQAGFAAAGQVSRGAVAFVTATLEGLDAAVCFYGGSIASKFPNGEPEGIEDAAQIKAPLLLVYGGKDAFITAEAVERTREALSAAGKRFEIQVYPDQDHAFFRNSGAELEGGHENEQTPHDVADAWDRVQAFLREHLR